MNSEPLRSVDSNGVESLLLRGAWSDAMARAIAERGWLKLGLHSVDWQDFTPLAPYESLIKWLVVPLGPKSSRGIYALQHLERLQMSDEPEPPIDFRRLAALRDLEACWDRREPERYSNPGLSRLSLKGVSGADLYWLNGLRSLTRLELYGRNLRSLSGLRNLSTLQYVAIHAGAACADIADIQHLVGAAEIEVDAPHASIPSLEFIADAKALVRLRLSSRVQEIDYSLIADHPSLQEVAFVSDSLVSVDNDAIAEIASIAGARGAAVTRIGRDGVEIRLSR